MQARNEFGPMTTESFPALRRMTTDPGYLPTRQAISDEIDAAFVNGVAAQFIDQEVGLFYELWNKEYIAALGAYMAGRVDQLGGTEQSPVRILEVGAGNGRLSQFLRDQLAELTPSRAQVIATDSGTNRIHYAFPVEQLACEDALRVFEPQIVIWSWMPFNYDFTPLMRRAPSVQEYLLIGDRKNDISGVQWDTWGRGWQAKFETPLYEMDGFEQVPLEELSALQVSRARLMNNEGRETSETISFVRRGY